MNIAHAGETVSGSGAESNDSTTSSSQPAPDSEASGATEETPMDTSPPNTVPSSSESQSAGQSNAENCITNNRDWAPISRKWSLLSLLVQGETTQGLSIESVCKNLISINLLLIS